MHTKINALVASIVLACIMTFSNSASAQSFSIGPRIGMNVYSTVSGLEEASTDSTFGGALTSSSITGLVFGAVANIGINDMFSIQPEILFSQQGVKQSASILGISLDAKTRLNYINVPILAKLAFGPENIKGFITAGPSFGYLMSGSITALGQTHDFEDSDYDQMNRMDIGLSFGAGGSLAAGPGNLNLDIRYVLGLSDINNFDPKPDNYKAAKNGVCSVTLAYLFKLGGE